MSENSIVDKSWETEKSTLPPESSGTQVKRVASALPEKVRRSAKKIKKSARYAPGRANTKLWRRLKWLRVHAIRNVNSVGRATA